MEWSRGVEFGVEWSEVEWSLLYNHVICVLEFGVELGNKYIKCPLKHKHNDNSISKKQNRFDKGFLTAHTWSSLNLE